MSNNVQVKHVNIVNGLPLKLELQLDDNSYFRMFTMNMNYLEELKLLYSVLGFNDLKTINNNEIPVYIRIDIDNESGVITKIRHIVNDTIELYEGCIKDEDVQCPNCIALEEAIKILNESYKELCNHKLALVNDYNKYKSLFEDASALISKLKYKFPDVRQYCEEYNLNKIESDKSDLSTCLSEEQDGQFVMNVETDIDNNNGNIDNSSNDEYEVVNNKKCKIELINDRTVITITPTQDMYGSKEPLKFILPSGIFDIVKNYSWRFTKPKAGKMLYFVPGRYSSGNHEIDLGQLCYGLGQHKMIFTEVASREFVVSTPWDMPILTGSKFEENKKELIKKYGEF